MADYEYTALTPMSTGVGNISALHDRPNVDDGLSGEQLRAKFDKAGSDIKEFINGTLISELDTKLAAIEETVDGLVAGTVTDGSVYTAAIQDLAVTSAKLSENAVTSGKILDGNVTTAKLDSKAVTKAKIGDNAVDTAQLADAAVTHDKLGANAVEAGNIKNGEVTNAKLAANSISYGKTDGSVQRKIYKATGTLTVEGWSNKTQALGISDMTATCEFVAAPSNATGWAAAADAMLYPPAAGAGTLTFTCETTPLAAIPVTVYFWEG